MNSAQTKRCKVMSIFRLEVAGPAAANDKRPMGLNPFLLWFLSAKLARDT